MEEGKTLVDVHESQIASLDSTSTTDDIKRHKIGSERYPIIKAFIDGDITAATGAQVLGLSSAQFYRICAQARGSTSYKAIVPKKPGRKFGWEALETKVEHLIQRMYERHYKGPAATYAVVWSACQAGADAEHIIRPSYHTVRRRISAKPERELYERKHGTEAAIQRYKARPGFKKTNRPLEWVQFDHTVVDILLVDDLDRTVIIGRPWISLAICLETHVILGFYLSLLPPSAVSVAMLIENCVMPKRRLLESLGLPIDLWPMHGVMETIHTDNAKEFVSDVLVLNCKEYGIDVKHRDIPQKHQGGHIESLIGKMMTKKIHFLPGTTGSNVLQRKALQSEKKASITFEKLRQIIVYQISVYHETKHSALNASPREAWDNYYKKENMLPRSVAESDQENFRYRFFPETTKQIVPEGIEMFRRFYYSSALKWRIREKVLVKYDPYDISVVMVKLDDGWLKVPCSRNPFERSNVFEIYRFERNQRLSANGTMSVKGGQSFHAAQEIVDGETVNTVKARRVKKKNIGVKIHNQYKEQIAKSKAGTTEALSNKVCSSRPLEGPVTPVKLSTRKKNNVVDFTTALRSQQQTDDYEPIIYEPVDPWGDISS